MAQSASLPVGPGDISPTGMTGSSTNPKMRKRTKTGCLTCRKRRIKCGEERPTCANCIKSKRQCEGYNQRVVFKPPIGDWPNHPGVVSTMQYHSSMLPGTRNQPFRPPQSNPTSPDGTHTSIQPRPFDFSGVDPNPGMVTTSVNQVLVGAGHGYSNDSNSYQPLQSPLHQQPLQSPHPQSHISPTSATYFPQPSPVHTSAPTQFSHEQTAGYQSSLPFTQSSTYPSVSVAYDNHAEAKSVTPTVSQQSVYQQSYQPSTQPEAERGYHSQSVSPRSEQYPQYAESRPVLQRFNSQPQVPVHPLRVSSADLSQGGSYTLPAAVSHADFSHASYPPVQIPIHDITSDVKYMPPPVLEQPIAISHAQQGQPRLLLSEFEADDRTSTTQVLDDAAVENEDDDYWDVDSDEEMLDVEPDDNEEALIDSKEFDHIRRIHEENFNEAGVRRYDAFLYSGLLTKYRPEYAASPLRNPKTARVFAHWIHVTGPTLSVFERNPRNSTLIFDGVAPPTQQGLWTYILPLKAFGHQGLLHAMLALASLHIARLQGASITPSYKHYAYSLKRLGRSLGNPKKRLSISTLATSLLLAYYEVWTAEHNKWSTHLVGAAQLISELDFPSLTLEAQNLRAAQTAQEEPFPSEYPEMLLDMKYFDHGLKQKSLLPDEDLVSRIVGKKVRYDNFGMAHGGKRIRQESRPSPQGKLDLRSYEILQDLYWWYSRHDMYQSAVGGNPLITAFRKWSDCPPRAPPGRHDAPYGSHDHIVLMIGRIADFTIRDRERKLRQVETDGAWRPRPGMPGFGSMGSPPATTGSAHGQPPTPSTPVRPPSQMHNVPPGWTGPPSAGFGPPQGSPSDPPFIPGPRTQSQGPNHPGGPPASAVPNFFGMAPSRPPAPLPASYQNPHVDHSPPTPQTPYFKYGDLPAAYDAAIVEWDTISAAHATIAEVLAGAESFSPLPADLYPPAPGMERTDMTPFGPAIVHRGYDISVVWMLLHLAKILLLRCHPAMPPAALMATGICAPATKPYATLIGQIAAGMHIPTGDLSPFLGSVIMEATMPLFFAGIQYQDPKQRNWLITRLLEVDSRIGWASAGVIATGCETAWQKAASMGRGPPYTRRRPRRIEEDGPLVQGSANPSAKPNWRETEKNVAGKDMRKMSQGQAMGDTGNKHSRRKLSTADQNDGPHSDGAGKENTDTRFVLKTETARFAANLLETEEDLRTGIEKIGL